VIQTFVLVLMLGCGSQGTTTTKNAIEAKDGGKTKDAGKTKDGGTDAASGTGTLHKIDRSGLTDVGTTNPLDYSDPNYWMCRPDIDPNACHGNLDATEIAADGSQKLVKFERAQDPKFDCFYVYPTVLLNGGSIMTDFSSPDIVLDPLLSQAATFTRICEVYAPLYRQNGLNASASGVSPAGSSNAGLGLKDVTDAFHYFLDHIDKDRKFVLMGHSQGTGVLTAMMKTEVDANPDVRARMISALLIGGGLRVPEGQRMGAPGSFANIPTCAMPGDTGCVIAYNSFAKENPPGANAIGGMATMGLEPVCTEPAALAGNSGRYKGSYVPMMVVNATFKADGVYPTGITTPFVVYRDLFKGQCIKSGGYNYLEISLEQEPGDMRMPNYRFTAGAEAIGFGLHIVDYNLELDDLIDAVAMQADAALK
jgi:pimeloyl-ACP methyl ester carboxylesterase